jgi:quinol monooxygenase YgiN
MGIWLIVTWDAKPGEEEAVAQLLQTMMVKSRAEPGCLRYEVLRAVDNPRQFVLLEIYESQAALETHTESEHFQRYVISDALPRLAKRDRKLYRLVGELHH